MPSTLEAMLRGKEPTSLLSKKVYKDYKHRNRGEKYICGRQALTLVLPSPFFHHPRVRPQEACLSVWGERGMLAHSLVRSLNQLSVVEYEYLLQDTHQSAASLPLMLTATVRKHLPGSQIISCLICSKILIGLESQCFYL